ncbi:MAG: hypothetical protein ACJ75R_01870 [Solirubrobacterales bacterium]
MLGAGTFINPLIKLITTLIILGAIYLFFVKPALDTTNNAFDLPNFGDFSSDVQSQIDDAITGTSDTDRLKACLKRAAEAGNEHRIQVCIDKFG